MFHTRLVYWDFHDVIATVPNSPKKRKCEENVVRGQRGFLGYYQSVATCLFYSVSIDALKCYVYRHFLYKSDSPSALVVAHSEAGN